MSDTGQTPSNTVDASQVPEGLRERHRNESMVVLNALETALLERAEAHGGNVPAEEISKLTETLRKQPDLFGMAFDSVATEFLALGRRREFAAIRQDSFGRLLVSRFAHLLEGREFGSLEEGAVSRSVIQPFFVAIRMMVGPDTLEEMQRKIDQMVTEKDADLGNADDPNFWLGLAEDPETTQRVTDLFANMLLRFRDYDKRKKWFIDLVNDNMPQPLPQCAGKPWLFADVHFVYIMTALFRDTRALLLESATRADLQERIGTDGISDLDNIFLRLDDDIAALQINVSSPPIG